MNDQEWFINNCQNRESLWTPECSIILRRNATETWLRNSVYKIFQDEVPNQRLTDPLPRKISSLSGDCLLTPYACQWGLNYACAQTSLSLNPGSGVNTLCGCFAPSSSSQQACDCRSSVTNFSISPCFGTYCTINNIYLSLYNSDIGDIRIFQQCGSNSFTAQSNCLIDTVSLVANGSEVSNISLEQECFGRGSVNNSSNVTNVNNNNRFIQSTIIPSQTWFYLLLLIFILFFFFFLLTLFLYQRETVPNYIYVTEDTILNK